MKINALSTTANLNRVNYSKNNNSKNNKNLEKQPNNGLSDAQKISFGTLGEILAFVAGALMVYTTSILAATAAAWVVKTVGYYLIKGAAQLCNMFYNKMISSKVDETNKNKEMENLKQKREEKINSYMKSMKLSRKQAEEYHDQFLGMAMIEPTNDGNEKGINAIMGYGLEKYNLAMQLLTPVIGAQNYQKEEARRMIPNGILLYGPGGSGKTYVANHVSEHLKEFGVNVVDFNFGLNHKKNAANLEKTFADAEKRFEETGKYTIIKFPQDLDKMFVKTSTNTEYLKEMAVFMQHAENSASKGVVWIATANNPKEMEQPVLRRATIKMPIGDMKDFQIGDMLKYTTMGVSGKEAADKVDYQKVVDYIRGINEQFTPDEYRNFTISAKAIYGEITADTLIYTINEYVGNQSQTLNEEVMKKFEDDRNYINSLDDEDN